MSYMKDNKNANKLSRVRSTDWISSLSLTEVSAVIENSYIKPPPSQSFSQEKPVLRLLITEKNNFFDSKSKIFMANFQAVVKSPKHQKHIMQNTWTSFWFIHFISVLAP